jgi:hypothetical protein
MITLTAAASQDTIATTAGTEYEIGIVGNTGGGLILLEGNLAGAPTEYSPLAPPVANGHYSIRATGTFFRATLQAANTSASVKIEATAAI